MRIIPLRKRITKFLSLLLITSLISAQSVRAVDIVVSENGSGSVSEASVETSSTTVVQQSNTANIDNNVNVSSDTGDNSASDNSGDSTQISTGDIVNSVDVENSTNISQANTDNCCTDQSTIIITGNGSESENTVSLSEQSNSATSINQSANITNNIQGYADTGNNSADNNTGDVSIQTGDIKVTGSIINDPINIADVNASGGNGGLDALMNKNGTDSQNSIYASFTNDNNVFLNQEANILNKVSWNLNTGGNSANGNTGDVAITTGDISLDFFIKNFVNLSTVTIDDCCRNEAPGDGSEEPNDPPGDVGRGGDGNGGGGSGGGGGGGGSLLSEAASTGIGGIIGLSDTSSEQAQALFFWIGLGLVVFGLKYITCEITSKKLAKRKLYL